MPFSHAFGRLFLRFRHAFSGCFRNFGRLFFAISPCFFGLFSQFLGLFSQLFWLFFVHFEGDFFLPNLGDFDEFGQI